MHSCRLHFPRLESTVGSLGHGNRICLAWGGSGSPQDSHCAVCISGHVLWQPEGPPAPLEDPQVAFLEQRRAGRLGATHPSAALCFTICSPLTSAASLCSPGRCCQPRATSGTGGWCRCPQLQDWLPWSCCSPASYSQVQLRCLAQGHQG